MKRSTFLLPDEELSEVAAQYHYDSGSGQYIPCSKGVQITKFGSKYESGGGGCISTVDDYIAFLEALKKRKTTVLDILFPVLTIAVGVMLAFGNGLDIMILIVGVLLMVDGILGLLNTLKK